MQLNKPNPIKKFTEVKFTSSKISEPVLIENIYATEISFAGPSFPVSIDTNEALTITGTNEIITSDVYNLHTTKEVDTIGSVEETDGQL